MSASKTHHGIVVGVDGSPPSKVAVDWAAREAAMRNLPLTIIHVIQAATVRMWPDVPMPPDLAVRFEECGEVILHDARVVAEDATGGPAAIRVDTELLSAAVLPTLIDQSKDAEMMVVGCRGLGAIRPTPARLGQLGPDSPCELPGRGHPRRGPVDADACDGSRRGGH